MQTTEKSQFQAIEAVADKRHGRMCQTMPEKEAANNIVKWLDYLIVKFKDNTRLVHNIKSLREGYTAF